MHNFKDAKVWCVAVEKLEVNQFLNFDFLDQIDQL